jgi:hypothetical protein
MPPQLNPRKAAKQGFYCTAMRSVQCADKENCDAKLSFGSYLSYLEQPEETVRAA